ncbi:MAG: response regulator [Syntrophaceae bacterium]|nr:response regulator [Syntrophaceae bacterium]
MANEILIADSDKADQEEFQRIFETTPYHLIFSDSGEEVLLRIKLFKPDLIIASGMGLREMGGLELCGVLKGDPEFKHIPFLLISDLFNEISEKDRQYAHADGVISKPLNEDEVLRLVDQLMEGAFRKKEGEKKGISLEEMEEEEIIDLVEVVEEPETRMSIHDFVTTEKIEKEEPLGEIAPLEAWEKLELDEKVVGKRSEGRLGRERGEVDLEYKKEGIPQEPSPEEELFKKIELEEILEKVEQLKPSIESEWPSSKEVRGIEEESLKLEEIEEKPLNLEEFEEAIQKEMASELPEEELTPFLIEEPKEEIPEEVLLIEESVEEELKELPEEEFPKELLEEILGEEEISAIEAPKGGRVEEVRKSRLEGVKPSSLMEEEIRPLVRAVDRQMQEVIAEKVQGVMEEIIKKLVPEMTQNVVSLTLDRIEKMVREVVPDLAEKAIQEEIKRLQKEEKE